jgi:hypothetical protein
MGVAITIKDEFSFGGLISKSVLYLSVNCISVKDLIETRVTEEVQQFNLKPQGAFTGLVQPTETETLLNGQSLSQSKVIDLEKQKLAAITAFKSNGFFLLVNDKQVTELDEIIFLTPDTVVTFLKLVLLVGG